MQTWTIYQLREARDLCEHFYQYTGYREYWWGWRILAYAVLALH